MILCVEVSVDPLEQVMRERARGRGEGGTVRQQAGAAPPHRTCLSLSHNTLSPGLGIDEWEDRGAQDSPLCGGLAYCVVAQLYRVVWCGGA